MAERVLPGDSRIEAMSEYPALISLPEMPFEEV